MRKELNCILGTLWWIREWRSGKEKNNNVWGRSGWLFLFLVGLELLVVLVLVINLIKESKKDFIYTWSLCRAVGSVWYLEFGSSRFQGKEPLVSEHMQRLNKTLNSMNSDRFLSRKMSHDKHFHNRSFQVPGTWAVKLRMSIRGQRYRNTVPQSSKPHTFVNCPII